MSPTTPATTTAEAKGDNSGTIGMSRDDASRSSGPSSNTSNSNGGNSNPNGQRNGQQTGQGDSLNCNFEGAEPKVGAVLALKIERMTKKEPFDIFKEKLMNYMGREIENSNDLMCILTTGDNPVDEYEKNNMPKDLTDEEKKSEVRVQMQKERIRLYIMKEDKLKSGMVKLYNVIWGQCSEQLQSVINFFWMTLRVRMR